MPRSRSRGGGLWGGDRIERTLPFSGTYTYNTTASNVYVYVRRQQQRECVQRLASQCGTRVHDGRVDDDRRARVAALHKARYGNVASTTIDSWHKNNATTNRISGNPSGTPNRLLFKSTL